MALSQVQCLDNNHINLRSNESKPDFFYSEEQRIALETLIRDGRDGFEDFIKTNNHSSFLSDLELQRILGSVEEYCPGSHCSYDDEGESDDEEVSLQYWPDRSDRSLPQLDIGWPERASYRGVTRVHVYTQPPYEGQAHIKEVVRKMISQAQKIVAVVMDLFTDIDIFKDLLNASYRRKVSVYIILESTGVKHFLKMCERAGMHQGHFKNLRVRSIRGTEFLSRSSKKLCGSQSQKFMFIDGDKAVSGSYSFTWSASRLDRNLITVLTGQAVDVFDSLFQDMYVMSKGVSLSKIHLSSEPEPEILHQTSALLLPSSTMLLKLINPKYNLVSNAFITQEPSPEYSISKTQKDVTEPIQRPVTAVHPGLLYLEKANMMNYIPTWPDPDPPSDVIGYINIRDLNKPVQAHLMRSELFEASQAIRFKDPFDDQGPIADQNTPTEAQRRLKETLNHFHKDPMWNGAPNKTTEAVYGPAHSEMSNGAVLGQNMCDDKVCLATSPDSSPPVRCSSETIDTARSLVFPKTPNSHPSTPSDDTKWEIEANVTKQNGFDSSFSSLSDEYYECSSSVGDSRRQILKTGSSHGSIFPTLPAQDLEEKNFFMPKLLKTSCSIVFNFLSTSISAPSFRENDTITDGKKSPVNHNYYTRPSSGGDFSSASEEYFECSDMLGQKSQLVPETLKESPAPELHGSVSIHQKVKEKQLKTQPGSQEQPEFQPILGMTAHSHLQAQDIKAVLSFKDDSQAHLNEEFHRQRIHSISESEFPSGSLQELEIMTSQKELEMQAVPQRAHGGLAEKTENMSVEQTRDLQLEASGDVMCEGLKTETSSVNSVELDINQDTECVGRGLRSSASILRPSEEQACQTQSTADLEPLFDCPSNLKSAVEIKCLVLELESPGVLKRNITEENPVKVLESVKLLSLEDPEAWKTTEERMPSDLTEGSRSAPSINNTSGNTESVEVKSTDSTEAAKKQDFHLNSPHGKQCIQADVEKEEHSDVVMKNMQLPEAKPVPDCLVQKKPLHHIPSRIPIKRETKESKLLIRPESHCSLKAGAYKVELLGNPQKLKKNVATSLEKPFAEGITPSRSLLTSHKETRSAKGPQSISKKPRVQSAAPKIRTTDQTDSKKRSSSGKKCGCPPFGLSCPGQTKKHAY